MIDGAQLARGSPAHGDSVVLPLNRRKVGRAWCLGLATQGLGGRAGRGAAAGQAAGLGCADMAFFRSHRGRRLTQA